MTGTAHATRPARERAHRPAPGEGPQGILSLKLARGRVASLVAVASAVLGGAALVTVGGVIADTGIRSVLPAERLAGTDVVVTAPQTLERSEDFDVTLPERVPLPEAAVAELAALPEVGAAVGDVGFRAAVLGADGPVPGADPRTAGHGWASATLSGQVALTGEPPAGQGEVVLDSATAEAAGASVGEGVRLLVGGEVAEYRLTGTLGSQAPLILVDDAVAAELSGRVDGPRAGTVDLVGLHAADGVGATELHSAVEASAVFAEHDLVALSGDGRGEAESPEAGVSRGELIAMAGSLSGVILLVIGFTVAGALSVSVAAQRRDLALIRAVGATPRQIRRLVAQPNLLVTAAALPFGIAAGYFSGERALAGFAAMGVVPPHLPTALGPVPGLAAAALMVLTVWLACLGATRRTANADPVDALAESVAEPRSPGRVRTWIGAALLMGSLAMSAPSLFMDATEAVAAAAAASLVAAIGLALAGPALVRRVSGFIAGRLPERVSPLTWLAVQNLHGHSVRVAGAVSALAMMVAFTLGQAYSQTSLSAAGDVQRMAGERADLVVTAPGLGGVPESLTETVRAAPAVAEAVTATPTMIVGRTYGPPIPGEEPDESYLEVSAQVVGAGAEQVLDPDVAEGDLSRLGEGTIALSTAAARHFRTDLGETLEFRAGDGTEASAEVVALYRSDMAYGWAVLSPDLAEGHLTGDADAQLRVLAEPGQEDEAREAVESAAEGYPGALVSDAAVTEEDSQGLDANGLLNIVVLMALVGYMVLSVANRLSAQTLQRQGEVDALRAVGMTPGQARSVMRREAVMIAAGAGAAGLLAVLFPLFCVAVGLLGRPFPAGPLWLVPVTVLGVFAVSWLCVSVPARRLTTDSRRR